MKNIKTILIAVLSFMLLFSVSCKNEDKTGGGSGGSVDVPTATGDPATDLTATATYSGTVNRTASEGNNFTETFEFVLNIDNNQIMAAGMFGGLSSKQILKSGSEYSANGEMSEGEVSAKEYIKFTVSTDGNSVELLEYTAAGSSAAGDSFKVTYSGGTLTKQ